MNISAAKALVFVMLQRGQGNNIPDCWDRISDALYSDIAETITEMSNDYSEHWMAVYPHNNHIILNAYYGNNERASYIKSWELPTL